MRLWKHLHNLWAAKSPIWMYVTIPNAHVDRPLSGSIDKAGDGYLRLRLNEMHLKYSRVGFRKMYPMLHCYTRFKYAGRDIYIPVVAGPGQIQSLQIGNLERILQLNHLLIGPIPYGGGDVEFLVMLFAAESNDYLDSFLDLLGQVSQLAGRSEIALALNMVSAIKNGLEKAIGFNQLQLQLGLHDVLIADFGVGQRIEPGYCALVAASQDQVPPEKLWVKESRLYFGDDSTTAKPLDASDYLLLSVEVLESRDAWNELPLIIEAYTAYRKAIIENNDEAIRQTYTVLAVHALESQDLIEEDQLRVIAHAHSMAKRLKEWRAAGLSPKSVIRGSDRESLAPEDLATAVARANPAEIGGLSRNDLLRLPF